MCNYVSDQMYQESTKKGQLELLYIFWSIIIIIIFLATVNKTIVEEHL